MCGWKSRVEFDRSEALRSCSRQTDQPSAADPAIGKPRRFRNATGRRYPVKAPDAGACSGAGCLGGFFRRAKYALWRVVVTNTDSGGRSFNFSEIAGNEMEAGLDNLYYPPEERGLDNTAVNWVSQLEAASLNNIVREFWPDILRRFLRQK